MVIGLLMLFFKFTRVVFLMVALEFMVLSTAVYLVLGGMSFFLLMFIFISVISSTLLLVFLVSLVKCYGEDFCFFSLVNVCLLTMLVYLSDFLS